MNWRPLLLACVFLGLIVPRADAGGAKKPAKNITWKKLVLDKAFRSEGVAVADVNKDGKMDILVGDVWYEAPDWKVHQIRPGKADYRDGDKNVYSNSFCCWAEDVNKDGWPDLIVVGFPGAPCYWYENPQNKPGPWKQHEIWHSACNETPKYVDLFKTGKRVLVMGWQPKGQENMGQMAWFAPGDDPTKPWIMHPISEPSTKGKIIPGTFKYAHGLGVGDVNGDGRNDVICTEGWWEQPAQVTDQPWQFHKANLGGACADMFAIDMDGDGTADIISTSAHNYGFWWYKQMPGKDGPLFVQRELFLPPAALAKEPSKLFNKDESALFAAINKVRQTDHLRAPWQASATLTKHARTLAEMVARGETPGEANLLQAAGYKGIVKKGSWGAVSDQLPKDVAGAFFAANKLGANAHVSPALEVGVGYVKGANGLGYYAIVVGDSGQFSLPAQTHAMHFVDIDGDGLKDLVTGRRWWAHGPKGDSGPNDPAYLYWFQAQKQSDGTFTFIPHEIDDDSGIGTQFAVEDLNGDGLLDIIISNKKGVFAFIQQRSDAVVPQPGKKE